MAPTHLLLDFFGTLVAYNPSRREQGFHASHDVARSLGVDLDYDTFLDAWGATFAALDARSDIDDSEFTMVEGATSFLAAHLDHPISVSDVDDLVATYMSEWNSGVVDIPGVPDMLEEFRRHVTIGVVTNTHSPRLVPDHLARMRVDHLVDHVITSVELGWRKPHPSIYAAALERCDAEARDCVFVGDSLGPDYLGPRAVGMNALLIDPSAAHAIDPTHRLASILDLPGALSI